MILLSVFTWFLMLKPQIINKIKYFVSTYPHFGDLTDYQQYYLDT